MRKFLLLFVLCLILSACGEIKDDSSPAEEVQTEEFSKPQSLEAPIEKLEYISETYSINYANKKIKLYRNGELCSDEGNIDKITDINTNEIKYYWKYTKGKNTLGEDTGFQLKNSKLYSADSNILLEEGYCIYKAATGNLVYKYEIDHITNEGNYGLYDPNNHKYVYKNADMIHKVGNTMYFIDHSNPSENNLIAISLGGNEYFETELPFRWDECAFFSEHIVFYEYNEEETVVRICDENLNIIQSLSDMRPSRIINNRAEFNENDKYNIYSLSDFKKIYTLKKENLISSNEGFISYIETNSGKTEYKIMNNEFNVVYSSDKKSIFLCSNDDGSITFLEDSFGKTNIKRTDGSVIAEGLIDYFDTGDGFIISTEKNYGKIDYQGHWIKKYGETS